MIKNLEDKEVLRRKPRQRPRRAFVRAAKVAHVLQDQERKEREEKEREEKEEQVKVEDGNEEDKKEDQKQGDGRRDDMRRRGR